ncbi:diguanylate cyclase [Alteromonadaceae bacterium BrNp21-10]|nr:diguanylate cyclase [Alteromonadaceae bacterium BrNp21-10]
MLNIIQSLKAAMNYSLAFRHHHLISVVMALILLACSLSFGLGVLKTSAEISWLDVIGEGSISLFTLMWIAFLLLSRPPGKVTTALIWGLALMMFSALLDVFDEFVHHAAEVDWLSMIESIPATFGITILSYGLYQWHLEQLALNKQLQRRESLARDHSQIDVITQLYTADYMRNRIAQQLLDNDHHDFSVVMLDIDDFDSFNRQHGHQEGDRILKDVANVILMNIRANDLACRYAGDRFILLLPQTSQNTANDIAQHIRHSLQHLAFKAPASNQPIYQSLTYAADEFRPGDQIDSLIQRINRRLDQRKSLIVNV